jgi:DNA-binding LacI/PurR family transcriptional regulator
MGTRAVDLLLDLIAGRPAQDVTIDDPPVLTVRASTGPPPAGV